MTADLTTMQDMILTLIQEGYASVSQLAEYEGLEGLEIYQIQYDIDFVIQLGLVKVARWGYEAAYTKPPPNKNALN